MIKALQGKADNRQQAGKISWLNAQSNLGIEKRPDPFRVRTEEDRVEEVWSCVTYLGWHDIT